MTGRTLLHTPFCLFETSSNQMRTLHRWADIELDYPVRYSDVIVRDIYGVGET